MLVQNKRKSIVFVPTAGEVTAQGLKLLPGVNDVDPDLWAKAKELKVIKHMLDNDELVEEIAGKAGSQAITKITALPDKAAYKVVRETLDADLLARWATEEKRPSVKSAIAAQLAKIAPDKKDDKGNDKKPDGDPDKK